MDSRNPDAFTTCPACGLRIGRDSTTCPYCDMDLSPEAQEPSKGPFRAVAAKPSLVKESYRSAADLGLAVRLMLTAWVVIGAIAVASDVAEFRLVGDLMRLPGRVTESTVTATDQRQTVIAFMQLFGTLAVGILFIAWTRRAYRNLWGLGTKGMRFSPGWAVGAWLIPILNLFRPKQIVDDVYRASDPDVAGGSSAWRGGPIPAIFHVWWALWVVGGVIGTWAGLQPQPATLAEYQAVTGILAVLDAMQTIAAVFAAWTVELTTQRQENRALAVLSVLPARSRSGLPPAARYGFVGFLGMSIFIAASLALA